MRRAYRGVSAISAVDFIFAKMVLISRPPPPGLGRTFDQRIVPQQLPFRTTTPANRKATGTATVTAAAPVWAALAGPVGWALIGVGAMVVPFAYRASSLKLRTQIEDAASDHIKKTFTFSCVAIRRPTEFPPSP
jgi:hypothetical protein